MNEILPPDVVQPYSIQRFMPHKNIVRTGVIADGSCFFHAFLRCFNHYKIKTFDKRYEMVRKLRKEIADTVSTSHDSLYNPQFKELRRMLFMRCLREIKPRVLPNHYIDWPALVDSVANSNEGIYKTFLQKVYSGIKNPATRALVKDWINEIFHQAIQMMLKTFQDKILNEQISSEEIGYISWSLKHNFIFINNTIRDLYPFRSVINESWPFIVLLWIDDSHYEILGQMSTDRKITRIFQRTDSFINLLLN